MPRDLSRLAAGEGGENDVDYLLNLAAGSDDTDAMDEDAVTGASETTSPYRPKLLFNNLLHVFVGPTKKQFDVHTELFCSISPYVADMLTGEAKARERRRLHHVRHKLQKVLFPKNRQPKNVELLAADSLLRKLEGLGEPDAGNIRATRIHKVLKAALKSSDIPSFEQWSLKKRMHLLLTTHERCLEGRATTTETAAASPEDTFHLPHHSETSFDNFNHWLYRKQLASPRRFHDGVWDPLTTDEFVELYTLADFLQVTLLQNLIADKLQSISPTTEGFRSMMLHASTNHTDGSKLLALLVRMYAQHATETEFRRAAGDWMDKDVVVEVTAVLLRDRERSKGKGPARKGHRCEYHVHNKANPPCI